MAGQNILQKLNAAKARPPVGAAGGRFNPLGAFSGGGLTSGALLGEYVLGPAAVGLGNYLRSPQGVLAKDRLRQGDIGGAFTALTGLGRSNAPRLTQFQPPATNESLSQLAAAVAGRTMPTPPPAALLDRAYQREKSRVAQLAAQNPELKRYEDARRIATAKGATPEQVQSAEDIGMQIWAQKYGKPGGLASKVKPGQAGYDVIQRTLFPQGTSLPPLSEASQAMLNEIAPANAQGVRENIMPMPGQMPVFGEASEAMYQAVTDGGKLVTPMPSPQAKMTQEAAAQSLADAYKSSIVGDDEFAQRLRAMQQYMQ